MRVDYPASVTQIQFLRPLRKWRILSLNDLKEECIFPMNYTNFARRIYRLENNDNLVKSFIDPYTKQKFIYLSEKGVSYICDKSHAPSISPQTLVHDAKVSILAREFLKLSAIEDFTLEHEFKEKLFKGYTVRADAILHAHKNEHRFKIALELELTRKCKSRITNKVLSQINSNSLDYIIYFFQDENLLKAYKRIIEEKLGEESNKKVLYALNPNLMLKDFNFSDTYLIINGDEKKLVEIFD